MFFQVRQKHTKCDFIKSFLWLHLNALRSAKHSRKNFLVAKQWAAPLSHTLPSRLSFPSMPGNLAQEFLQTRPTSTPLSKHPTTDIPSTSNLSYPGTHLQAIARFHQHWRAREYAAAADYAAVALSLALDAGHTEQAAKYANARQLAHKYQALKVQLHKLQWNVAVDPILEPDDPPSSEARCNMVCTPDRPELLHLSSSSQPQHLPNQRHAPLPNAFTVEQQPRQHQQQTLDSERSSEIASTFTATDNQTQLTSQCPQPCDESHKIENDAHVTVCCLAIPWPWKRAR